MAGKITYVQDKETGKFVEKNSLQAGSLTAAIHTMEEFISPIDQSVIRTPSDLARHNKQHGVTDFRDYSPEFLERKQKERVGVFNERGKQDRINDLNAAYEKHRR